MRLSRSITARFSFLVFAFLACATWATAATAAAGKYIGPVDVVASPDHKSLYVVAADAAEVIVVDVASRKKTKSFACPDTPSGLVVSPDGKKLYVTCGGPKGIVCVMDAASGKTQSTIAVGHTPNSPVLLPGGKRLVVCNRFNDDVSFIDLAQGKETNRVKAIREPCGAAATPDGKLVFVTNLLPVDPADSYDVAAEVTVIDTATLKTSNIRLPNGSSSVHEVCVSPDGAYAYVVHTLSRYQMPTTQLERGWMNTNALSVIEVAQRKLLNTVLLDDIDLGAANPFGVATTADGKQIIISHRGTHELSVIDAEGLIEKLKQQRDELAVQIHLGKTEAKQEWDKLNARLEELMSEYEPLQGAVRETATNVLDALKLTASELQDGFERIRKTL